MDLPSTHPCSDLRISDICTDSREVQPGSVFFARAGARHDGRRFISQAADQGAVAAVVANAGSVADARLPVLEVDDFDAALAVACANFFGQPTRHLKLIGVTGTNGKTTVAHLCSEALNEMGGCGVLGTLGIGRPGALRSSLHTTPELTVTNAVLAQSVEAGCEYGVMEVSSHGISQRRIEGLVFDTALYTNLSRDHLDYHGDMDRYASTKSKLFNQPELRQAVVNADDEYAERMVQDSSAALMRYSLERDAADDCVAARAARASSGVTLQIDGPLGRGAINSALIGRFNAYNLLAAATTLAGLGLEMTEVCEQLSAVTPAPGRMQWLGGAGLPVAVIDYSHTPDALEKALLALREGATGALWCVFGCGGDRDAGKRPQMGLIAERHADHVIVTDDNPRNEASAHIITEITAGMDASERVFVEPDRAKAIELALTNSKPADIVLIAGKGHEPYQERNGVRSPFSDFEVAAASLARRGNDDA